MEDVINKQFDELAKVFSKLENTTEAFKEAHQTRSDDRLLLAGQIYTYQNKVNLLLCQLIRMVHKEREE